LQAGGEHLDVCMHNSGTGIVDYGFPDKVEATLRDKVTLTL
jgi:hypothetical protein